MGGSAFGKDRPASRLSTPQFKLLQKYCQDRLAPHFTQVLPLLSFSEKTSHGDVDLICAHVIPFDQKKVKGEDWGVIGDTGEDEGKGAWHPVQGGRRDAAEGKEGEENAKYRAWVVDIVRTLRGREWKRSGVINGFINVGIPISKLEGLPGEALLAEGVLNEVSPSVRIELRLTLPVTSYAEFNPNHLLSHPAAVLPSRHTDTRTAVSPLYPFRPLLRQHSPHARYYPYISSPQTTRLALGFPLQSLSRTQADQVRTHISPLGVL